MLTSLLAAPPPRRQGARLLADRAHTTTPTDIRALAVAAARAADDKQGVDTLVLEVGAVLAITDFFVITSAGNDRLVRTIAEEVEKRVKEAGGPGPIRTEGLDDLRWVLLDYGDFVVHVFFDETRRYYELERLWSDVPRVDWRAGADRAARAAGD